MKNFIALLFFICISVGSLAQNIVQGEYFIDTDLGFGNNSLVNFAPSPDNGFALNIDLSSYQPGYHKLYLRTRDSDGKWSLTTRRTVEVLASGAKTSIVRGEYFIDADPGFGMAAPVTITSPDSIMLQNFSAATAGLSEGFHKLYGRFEDNLGRWSLTLRRSIEIYKSDINKVVNGEYFFNTDQGFGNCAAISFAVPAADGSFLINIPRNTIPAGADTLFIRVRDDIENRWSITTYSDLSAVLPLTLINFTATKKDNNAVLNWQTANEINTAYFNVERSSDAINFTAVGKVTAKRNSGLQNDYSYTDDIAALNTGKVYYRLQMMDADGKFTNSRIAYITINAGGVQIVMYPNPAHNYFVIGHYENLDTHNARIVIRDATGRMIIDQKFNNTTEQKINITSLSKGIYMVSVVTTKLVCTQKLLVK